MRILLAVVALTLSCAPLAFANGATVTPPTEADIITVQPPVVPVTPQPTPGVVPGAGPEAITTSVTGIPISVPVLVHRNALTQVMCPPSVTVLVPARIDAAMASRIAANNQLAVVMAPVTLPVVASPAVADRVIAGAGPCPVTVDQAAVNRIVTNQQLAVLALVSPVQFDENMLNMVTTGQPIAMQQDSFNRITTAGQPIMAVPLTPAMQAGTPAMAGRGPTLPSPLSAAEAGRVLSGGTVMVAMAADRQTLGNLVTNNTVQMVVPMVVPVPITPTTLMGTPGTTGTTTSPGGTMTR